MIPRPEYPRPQFARQNWINLNGEWQFETDPGRSGKERKLYEADRLSEVITVPFCPESRLSGLAHRLHGVRVVYAHGGASCRMDGSRPPHNPEHRCLRL